jgi:hypothetical protein
MPLLQYASFDFVELKINRTRMFLFDVLAIGWFLFDSDGEDF